MAALFFGHPAAFFAAVLICGVIFTLAHRHARKPVVAHLREQLLTRPECLDHWGDDAHHRELAAVLCTTLARVMKWPNDHFIPEDPMELAFFEVSGIDEGLETVEVAAELRKKAGIEINWQQLREIASNRPLTLLDLLNASLQDPN